MATNARDVRLDLRLPSRQKELIERAAAQLGQTTSGFVLEAARRRARKVLKVPVSRIWRRIANGPGGEIPSGEPFVIRRGEPGSPAQARLNPRG